MESGFTAADSDLGWQIALALRNEMAYCRMCGSLAAGRVFASLLALQFSVASASAQTAPTELQIITVQGEGATGPVRQPPREELVVRVLDEDNKPVSGAAVVFILPTEGPTGAFGGGAKTITVLTDADGLAAARGFRFNEIPGKVPVHVNVSYKGVTARSGITLLSTAPAGYKAPAKRHGSGKVIAVIAAVAAAGAAGAVVATRKTGSSQTAAPSGVAAIGLTPGTGTLAPPH